MCRAVVSFKREDQFNHLFHKSHSKSSRHLVLINITGVVSFTDPPPPPPPVVSGTLLKITGPSLNLRARDQTLLSANLNI